MWSFINKLLEAFSSLMSYLGWRQRKKRMKDEARKFEEALRNELSSAPKTNLDNTKDSIDPTGVDEWNRSLRR